MNKSGGLENKTSDIKQTIDIVIFSEIKGNIRNEIIRYNAVFLDPLMCCRHLSFI